MEKQTFNVTIDDNLRVEKKLLDNIVVNATEDDNNLRIYARIGLVTFNLFKGNKNIEADRNKYGEYIEGLLKNRYELRVYVGNNFKPTLEKKLI